MKEHWYELWLSINEPFHPDTTVGLRYGFISMGFVIFVFVIIAAISR